MEKAKIDYKLCSGFDNVESVSPLRTSKNLMFACIYWFLTLYRVCFISLAKICCLLLVSVSMELKPLASPLVKDLANPYDEFSVASSF